MHAPHAIPDCNREGGGLAVLPPGCVVGQVAAFGVANAVPLRHRVTPSLESIVLVQEDRKWDGHPAECCGRCDGPGVATCLLSCFVPFLALGMNKRRAFGASMVLWSFVFLLVYLCQYYNVYVHSFLKCDPLATSCQIRWDIFWIGGLSTAGMIIVLGALNRCSMRKEFNLPGDDFYDCMLWSCCSPCALCQETRTLIHNNVENGMWKGRVVHTSNPANAHVVVGLPVQNT